MLVTCTGGDLGLLIGKHGQTIDSLQYLANVDRASRAARASRSTIDAAGYRDRRRATLEGDRVAQQRSAPLRASACCSSR